MGKNRVFQAIKKYLQLEKGNCINSNSLSYLNSYTKAYVYVTPRAKSARGIVNHLHDMPVQKDESPIVFLEFWHDLRRIKAFDVFAKHCTYIHLDTPDDADKIIQNLPNI